MRRGPSRLGERAARMSFKQLHNVTLREDRMASYNLKINGEARVVDVDPDTPMLYVLRDNLALKGPKFGCGLAQCGASAKPSKLQLAFIQEQAAQCGYCVNGMIMTSAALLAKNKSPSETEIRAALADNLCRCGTHQRIVAAVKRAAAA
jgi:nicotinate dehydrogenase subunit A